MARTALPDSDSQLLCRGKTEAVHAKICISDVDPAHSTIRPKAMRKNRSIARCNFVYVAQSRNGNLSISALNLIRKKITSLLLFFVITELHNCAYPMWRRHFANWRTTARPPITLRR